MYSIKYTPEIFSKEINITQSGIFKTMYWYKSVCMEAFFRHRKFASIFWQPSKFDSHLYLCTLSHMNSFSINSNTFPLSAYFSCLSLFQECLMRSCCETHVSSADICFDLPNGKFSFCHMFTIRYGIPFAKKPLTFRKSGSSPHH